MWAHGVNALIGIWLMVAPAVVTTFSDPASINNRIFGPMIVAFGVVALWEEMRSVRFANTAIGGWLLISTVLLGYQDVALVTNLIAAGATIALSRVRGEHDPLKFGGGWVALWNDEMWERGGSQINKQTNQHSND